MVSASWSGRIKIMQTKAFSFLLCTGECGEAWPFLRKGRDGIGNSVNTRSENALARRYAWNSTNMHARMLSCSISQILQRRLLEYADFRGA
jgi:hypothetical protein